MVTQTEKADVFRRLHEGPPFIIPNPWDVGSARVLQHLGFEALATTSSGFAFSLGRRDGHVTLDEVVTHVAALASSTDIPITTDLENGYSSDARGVAQAIVRVAGAGAVGASIEDYDSDAGLYDRSNAAERVAAATEAATDLGFPFTITARAENHIRGNPDIDDTIARLKAYEEAGADVLYAPGLATTEEIKAVCDAVAKPVNVLALGNLSFEQIATAGAQRVSVGGALTWVSTQALMNVARRIRETGDLSGLGVDGPPRGSLL